MVRPGWLAAAFVASLVVGALAGGSVAYASAVAGHGSAVAVAAPSARPAGRAGQAPASIPARAPDPARWAAGVAPAAPSARRPHASIRDTTTATTVKSTNWSGQVDVGPAPTSHFTAVSGTWTVPTIQPSTSAKFVSTWVGIGGITTRTGLIQTGTIEYTAEGAVLYGAWYELIPTSPVTLTTLVASDVPSPGDTMHASITEPAPTHWDIVLQDVTKGWTFSKATVAYSAGPALGADWVTERPSLTTSFTTLADYGSSRFTDLQAAVSGGSPAEPPPASMVPIAMVDATTDVISTAGAFGAATTGSFVDSYVAAPTTRIYGTTADATAAAELAHQFPYFLGVCPQTPTATSVTRPVVLATDRNYPDALASAYLASFHGTGTLLTPTSALSPAARTAIRDDGITRVYVVGGPLAVATAVVTALQSTTAFQCGGLAPMPGTQKIQVTRIYGQTQYDTAERIATTPPAASVGRIDVSGAYGGTNGTGGEGRYNVTAGQASKAAPSPTAVPTAILASGANFPDAEAASTLAYEEHVPILLTTPTALSPQAQGTISTLGIRQVILMGGQLAVSNKVVTSLAHDGVAVLRVAGADYTQTAVELAGLETGPAGTTRSGLGWPGTGSLTVARGDFYTDGLAGAVVAADGPASTAPQPLLLTDNPTTVGSALATYLQEAGTTGVGGVRVTHLTILGGPLALTPTTAHAMDRDLGS